MEYVCCNLCGADDTVVRFPATVSGRRTAHGRHTLSDENARDLRATFACTCNSYGDHDRIVQCRRCGLVYSNPRLDAGDILDTYEAVEDPLYLEEREGRVLTFKRCLRSLERFMGSKANGRSLLDVGCSTGVLLEVAEQRGWEAWGVEPSHWAVKHARAKGLRVVQGTLDDDRERSGDHKWVRDVNVPDFSDARFDVVTMWDVIEHVTDPSQTLRQAHRLLKPGGILMLHTMDIESPFARLMGKRWPWLMQMHTYYFSRRTLRAMLESCGFEVCGEHSQGHYLRLGYLASRVRAWMPLVGRPGAWLVRMSRIRTKLGIQGLAIPVNLGDLFIVYARKT